MGLLHRIARGGVAGAAATLPMTSFMVAARRQGVMRAEEPPVEITERVADAADVESSRSATTAAAGLAHVAFGGGAGALFACLARRPGSGTVAAGVGFGLAVWAVSYGGWLPALGLMPEPTDDDPGRPLTMAAAHVVYGACLGAAIAFTND